jgi:hypothetical protein
VSEAAANLIAALAVSHDDKHAITKPGAPTAPGDAATTGRFSDHLDTSQTSPGSTSESKQADQSLQMQRDLGIAHDPQSCTAWGIASCEERELARQGPAIEQACHALRRCTAAIAGARLAAVVLQHAGWCRAALQTAGVQLQELRTLLKLRHARTEAVSPVHSSKAKQRLPRSPDVTEVQDTAILQEPGGLKQAVAGLTEPFEGCLELLDDIEFYKLDPETVVFIACNLDSMYYVALDLHLTAGACLPGSMLPWLLVGRLPGSPPRLAARALPRHACQAESAQVVQIT